MKTIVTSERRTYYIVAVDDDYKPVHTTKICSSHGHAVELRDAMRSQYHDAILCVEADGL